MLDFPLNADDKTILNGVRQWIELLADERYDEAVRWLYCPAIGTRWTPSLLKSLVANYGFVEPRTDGKIYHVTSTAAVKTGRDENPYQDVEWFPNDSAQVSHGVMGMVHFDLPLNGEWSDVTATFLIHKVAGKLLLQLEDMHVL